MFVFNRTNYSIPCSTSNQPVSTSFLQPPQASIEELNELIPLIQTLIKHLNTSIEPKKSISLSEDQNNDHFTDSDNLKTPSIIQKTALFMFPVVLGSVGGIVGGIPGFILGSKGGLLIGGALVGTGVGVGTGTGVSVALKKKWKERNL